MKYHITTLKNGLRVITTPMHEARSVVAEMIVGTGSRYEDFSVNGGVSHFLEHLLFKGTKRRPSSKIISEEIDAVGGYNNAYTSNDLTNFYVKVPMEHATLAIDILCDMIANPLFDSEEIDRERNVVVEEMNVFRDDPARHIGTLVPPLLWPGNALGYDIIGSEEVIRDISRDDIVAYKSAHYKPGNLIMSVAGNISHEEVVAQVEHFLGALESGSTPHYTPIAKGLASDRVAAIEKDTAQAHFTIDCLAYPYRHPNEAAAHVVTNILGRGMSSRLFVNIREHKGLAYAVSASQQNFVDTGQFEVYAGVSLDKITQAIEAVLHELTVIAEKPVSAAELAKAKNQARGGLQMALESNINVAERQGSQAILLNSIQTPEETLAEIDAVSREDVQLVAAEMFAPNNLRMGIIAPDSDPARHIFEQLTKK